MENNIYFNPDEYDLTSLTSHSLSQLKNILESYRHNKYIFILTGIKHSKIFFLSLFNKCAAALTFRLQQILIKNLKLVYISVYSKFILVVPMQLHTLQHVLGRPLPFPLRVAVPAGVPPCSLLSVLSVSCYVD